MGSRGLGQSDAAQQIKQSLGHSREGGMLQAGIHAEQNTPTQPHLQPRGTGSSSEGGEQHSQPTALTRVCKSLTSKVCSE